MEYAINVSSDNDSNTDDIDPYYDFPEVNLKNDKNKGSNKVEEVLDLTQEDEIMNPQPSMLRNNKGKKKSNSAIERENKKQRTVEHKLAKQASNEMNKVYKPGECMKYMSVEIHPALLDSWYMADLVRELSSVGARAVPTPALCDPAVVMWSRTMPQTLAAEDGQVKLTPSKQSCGIALYILTAAEAAEHVSARCLAQHVAAKRDLLGSSLTLVVFGVKEYLKKSGRKTANSGANLMSELDLEMAITDLLVSAGCDALQVDSPSELALLVVRLTRAVAEAPYKKAKRACDEQADFYMRGDNKNTVAIDKHGNGAARVWQQMLAVLPQSSLETSRALCARYSTPLAMYEAFQEPGSVSEVADIGVSRAGGPGCRARRLGPEFARKLHTLFTASDGNMLLD